MTCLQLPTTRMLRCLSTNLLSSIERCRSAIQQDSFFEVRRCENKCGVYTTYMLVLSHPALQTETRSPIRARRITKMLRGVRCEWLEYIAAGTSTGATYFAQKVVLVLTAFKPPTYVRTSEAPLLDSGLRHLKEFIPGLSLLGTLFSNMVFRALTAFGAF